ncbi:MAG: hypothetical protein D6711_05795 [Chloroflexi bacterium]|nr:MAG: hypothetical protein D6711_05795 [Chloroflexota bacterium]
MIWLVILIVVGSLIVMGIVGRQQAPWVKQLRRVNAGIAYQAEWMAPDEICRRVELDYLEAMQWLKNSQSLPWEMQWEGVSHYFTELQLKRHQAILKQYRIGHIPRYLGVFECLHQVTVRHFSEDGERCLVIDDQVERYMLTYRIRTSQIHTTQKLPPATLVYEMRYDFQMRRWKVARYIQQLPPGWQYSTRYITLSSVLPPSTGRDG